MATKFRGDFIQVNHGMIVIVGPFVLTGYTVDNTIATVTINCSTKDDFL